MAGGSRQHIAWVIWTVQLVAALVAVSVLNGRAAGTGTPSNNPSVARYGFQLTQVNARAGIDFTHQAPTFDARLEHIMPQVASTGASVTIVDFDRDGWLDFYATTSNQGGLNRLYRNKGDGTFVDVAAAVGLADVNRPGTGVSMGAVWGDYDNDGFEDLLLYRYGRPELFRNREGQSF